MQVQKIIFFLLFVLGYALHSSAQIVVKDTENNKNIAGATYNFKLLSDKKWIKGVSDANGIIYYPESWENQLVWIQIYHPNYGVSEDTLKANKNAILSITEKPIVLNDIVLTAQYKEGNANDAVHKINVITADKIEKMAAVNLRDVLSNELNVRIQQDNILGAGVSMQGIRGENVKIMIDGVPVIGRQNGNVDISQINLNDVERIEIIEGPLSVNYGTNALAGTINIITKKKSKKVINLEYFNYLETIGTHNNSVALAHQSKIGRFALSGNRNYFDGWNPGDKIGDNFKAIFPDSSRFMAWKPREQYNGRLSYYTKYKKLEIGLKTEYFKETIINRGLPRGAFGQLAFDDYYYTTRWDNALMLDGKVNKTHQFKTVSSYNFFERQKNTYVNDLTSENQFLRTEQGDQDTSNFNLWMSRGSIFRAKDSAKVNYEIGYDINYESTTGVRIENQRQSIGDFALFSSAEITPIKNLVIRPGLRYAYNTAYQAPVIPSINLKKDWGKGYKYTYTLRASYAKGFRAPALRELYFFFVDVNHNIVGNPNLKAEKSDNFTLNFKNKICFDKWVLKNELGVFYNDIRNLITLAQTTDLGQFSYINVGVYKTYGVNVQQNYQFNLIKYNIGFSYIGLYNQISENKSVSTFSYYPEVQNNIQWDIPKTKSSLSVFYKYQGRLPGFFVNEDNEIEESFVNAYHNCDATLSNKLYKQKILLAIGVKNIFNVQNVAANRASGVHSGSGSSVPVATGRFFFIKTTIKI